MLALFLSLLSLLCLVSSTATPPPSLLGPPNLQKFTWTPSSNELTNEQQHYAFGHSIGQKFAENIQVRMNSNNYLMKELVPYFTGTSYYTTLLERNNATYPMYVLELKGLSDGSRVPFEVLFINQMSEEFSYFYKPTGSKEHNNKPPLRCSDLVWISGSGSAYLAHNEDSGGGDVNHTALISAPKGVGIHGVPFTTYTYLGNIPTGAYGWNAYQLLFTMNYVSPLKGDLNGGLGRVFMARDLLEMTTIENGIERITRNGIAAGHNYQLFDLKEQRVWNVEVASFGLYSVREFHSNELAYFHANTYQTLNIPQNDNNSSSHRDARAKVMLKEHPITQPKDMLNIIGDQSDVGWPIYHDNLSHERGEHADWTLCTIFVNPTEQTISIYTENPKMNAPIEVVNLKSWFHDLNNDNNNDNNNDDNMMMATTTMTKMMRTVANATYRPVVIMHGMNNNERGYAKNIDSLEKKYPGIYVLALPVFDDLSSILTSMDKQLAAVIDAIRADPVIVAAGKNGFNFYGESQGALLARAYVTACNDPPVHNLVALNGPQAGVGECPTIDGPFKNACGDLGTAIDLYDWPFCSFCSYWKGNVDKSKYLKKSKWLAMINNDRNVTTVSGSINETYRQNMISLNQYMATYAEQDTTVQPPQSAWHTYWRWGDKERNGVMELNETEGYIHDVLGLRTLNERGDLILNSFNGRHVSYEMKWWNTTVLPMFDN